MTVAQEAGSQTEIVGWASALLAYPLTREPQIATPPPLILVRLARARYIGQGRKIVKLV